MAETAIEWTATYHADGRVTPGYTFNPWLGCQHVSPACEHCYAESWALRMGKPELWASGSAAVRQRTTPAYWRQPLKWAAKTPGAKVFCASLADVFESRPELVPWRVQLFELIRATPALTWLLLTKRPDVAARWFKYNECPSNVWLGTTVEDQRRADERIPILLEIPVPVRFLSCEPLLGPLDLSRWIGRIDHCRNPNCGVELSPQVDDYCPECEQEGSLISTWGERQAARLRAGERYANGGPGPNDDGPQLHWVIGGFESGGSARPGHPLWAQLLRDGCVGAGVPFFWKQWGEWLPISQMADGQVDALYRSRRKAREFEDQDTIDELYGRRCTVETTILHADGTRYEPRDDGAFLTGTHAMQTFRVRKKRAGRLLDGREWNEQPRVGP